MKNEPKIQKICYVRGGKLRKLQKTDIIIKLLLLEIPHSISFLGFEHFSSFCSILVGVHPWAGDPFGAFCDVIWAGNWGNYKKRTKMVQIWFVDPHD